MRSATKTLKVLNFSSTFPHFKITPPLTVEDSFLQTPKTQHRQMSTVYRSWAVVITRRSQQARMFTKHFHARGSGSAVQKSEPLSQFREASFCFCLSDSLCTANAGAHKSPIDQVLPSGALDSLNRAKCAPLTFPQKRTEKNKNSNFAHESTVCELWLSHNTVWHAHLFTIHKENRLFFLWGLLRPVRKQCLFNKRRVCKFSTKGNEHLV